MVPSPEGPPQNQQSCRHPPHLGPASPAKAPRPQSPLLTCVDQAVDADAHEAGDDRGRDGDQHGQRGAPGRLCQGRWDQRGAAMQEVPAPHGSSLRHQALTTDHIRSVCPFLLHHEPLLLTAAGKNKTSPQQEPGCAEPPRRCTESSRRSACWAQGRWLGAHPALGPMLWDGDARLLAPSCSRVLHRTRRSVDLRPALTEKPWGLGTSAVAEQLRDGLMTGYKWLHGEVISGRRYKQSEIQWLATEARLIQSGSKAHVSSRECKEPSSSFLQTGELPARGILKPRLPCRAGWHLGQ